MTSQLQGTDAILHARQHWPDLLPDLHPIVVKAPSPPMLDPEWPAQRMVDFLVEAYLTFGRIHCPPAFWQRYQIAAMAARKGEGRAASLHAKLTEAAKVMAGLGWGPMDVEVEAGKLPREIAPHGWLLWSVGNRVGVAGSWPTVDSVFAPNRLLQSKNLRIYSHTAADLTAGATRYGASLGSQKAIGDAYAALKVREQAIYTLGFSDRASCEGVIGSVGACRADLDLRAQDELERQRARELERQLAAMAERGSWVWGQWLIPKAVRRPAKAAGWGVVA